MNLSISTVKKIAVSTLTASALAAALIVPNVSQAGSPTFDESATIYKSKCASCHNMNGDGQTAKGKELKVRAFNSAEVKGMSDAKLLDVMLKGKGKMPSYEKSLGKDKCQALVSYVRGLGK